MSLEGCESWGGWEGGGRGPRTLAESHASKIPEHANIQAGNGTLYITN